MLMYRCEKENSHENQLWSEREECPVESHNVSLSCDPYNSAYPESWKSNLTLTTFKSTCVDLVRKMLTEMRKDPIRSCYHYSITKQNILKESNNSKSEQMSYWDLSKASSSFFFFFYQDITSVLHISWKLSSKCTGKNSGSIYKERKKCFKILKCQIPPIRLTKLN